MPDALLNRTNARDESKALMGSGLVVLLFAFGALLLFFGWGAAFIAAVGVFGFLMVVIGYDTFVTTSED